ncbi:hypothetical protein GCM10010365_41860 [Streptomyces poonensis]|uniref:Uncharacterized protein n=1 Tax=Streptomyces poonensis TaxID=68255 RepID=A0A918PQI4_9ACTN|nr:hypothetical protein GCM10010365_41860 [Streptomyces poonensis]GLJ90968.1 hypothetical protein GCM10017589_35740 [Streptomyces poonensis]
MGLWRMPARILPCAWSADGRRWQAAERACETVPDEPDGNTRIRTRTGPHHCAHSDGGPSEQSAVTARSALTELSDAMGVGQCVAASRRR